VWAAIVSRENAQLPPDEARDRRELELQAMRLGPLQPVKGYSSPEIDAASSRALSLCWSLGDRAKLFPVLYARWAFQYVAGRTREGFALSREYLEAARASGDDAALMVGLRIHAAGDANEARELVREALPLYVPERHRSLIVRFAQDLRAQNLIYLALSEALLGKLDEARALGDEAIKHARSVNHVNTLGYTLFHCGVWLQAILRQTDALRRHGAELLELAREHRLGFWRR
jgi:tetratricopeptide (TPR) repeat protein